MECVYYGYLLQAQIKIKNAKKIVKTTKEIEKKKQLYPCK